MNYAINQLDMIVHDVACDLESDYSSSLKIRLNFLLVPLLAEVAQIDH